MTMAKRKCTSTDLQNTARYIHIKLRIEQHERTPINTGGELKCSGKIGSSWFTSGIHRVTIYTNPVIRLMILTLLQKKNMLSFWRTYSRIGMRLTSCSDFSRKEKELLCSLPSWLVHIFGWGCLYRRFYAKRRSNYCDPLPVNLLSSEEAEQLL